MILTFLFTFALSADTLKIVFEEKIQRELAALFNKFHTFYCSISKQIVFRFLPDWFLLASFLFRTQTEVYGQTSAGPTWTAGGGGDYCMCVYDHYG